MSPEQANGEKLDHRSDLFSLGVVLYLMTAGRLPFQGATVLETMLSVGMDVPAAPAELNPAVPPALSDLVMRLLSKNPGGRPASAAAVAEELSRSDRMTHPFVPVPLAEAVESDPWANLDLSQPEPTPQNREGPDERSMQTRGGRGWLWGVAALLLIGLGFGLWFVKKPAEPGEPPVRGRDDLAAKGPSPSQFKDRPEPVPNTMSALDILTSPDWEWTEPENLGEPVNSAEPDRNPSLTADGLRLVFRSFRDGESRLFEARRQSVGEPFRDVRRIEELGGADGRINAPFLSADGLSLLFSRHPSGEGGNHHLWVSRRSTRDAPWETPTGLGAGVNSDYDEGNPALSPDGSVLYFTRWRSPAQGHDLMQARWTGERWAEVRPIDPGINTAIDEWCPRPLADGKAFAFHRGAEGNWLLATPAGDGWAVEPILSGRGYGPPSFTGDGRTVVFGSDMPGGSGKFDLWQMHRVPKVRGGP
jgi:hypothetical protein